MYLEGFSYKHHETNIHEFALHDGQTKTIDTFFVKLEEVLSITPPDQTLLLLIHVSHMPSIQYMIGHSRTIRARFPRKFKVRTAVLHPTSAQLFLLNTIGRALTNSSIRLFYNDKRTDALSWLAE